MTSIDNSKITVILPALNEAEAIRAAIDSAQSAEGVDVIVADGGSHDDTVQVARECGASVVVSQAGRAQQMNAAAATVREGILLFLHADTQLPSQYDQTVRGLIDLRGVVAGAFRLEIDSPRWSVRILETLVNFRSRRLQMPYGDQAIFMRMEMFRRLGGFTELPVMEDYDLVRRLRRYGRVGISRDAVKTSARRWSAQGVGYTTITHQLMIVAYHLGLPLHRIASWRRVHSVTMNAQPSRRSY